MNVREYWEKRWHDDGSYTASWPDVFARLLELNFINQHLPMLAKTVFEIGCGPFSLSENPHIAEYLDAWGRAYVGVDSSESAIRVARARAPFATFHVADLEDLGFEWAKADLLISRRVLQNLAPAHRGRLLNRLQDYPHGILIEGTLSGLKSLNDVRDTYYLPHLQEPEFNQYLNAAEERQILALPQCRKVPFMSTYYRRTRGTRILNGWNSEDHYAAYKTTLAANEGELGPVQGFVWGSKVEAEA